MTRKVSVPGLIVLLSVVCLASSASAQTRWWKTYGGQHDEVGYSVRQTTDSGYITAGYTWSYGAGGRDLYLIKSNAQGDTVWTRTYGGAKDDYGTAAQQTADGGYVITGYTWSYGAGGADAYLVKADADGDTLWTRTYGGPSDDVGNSVQQTTDGGYIIEGFTWSFGAGAADVYLIKTNAQGETLWTRTYGGSNVDGDVGGSVQQTADGGYIVASSVNSFGAGRYDVYLIKTNAQGGVQWTRTYGGADNEYANAIQQTADSGYIVVGYTGSFGAGNADFYVIRTSASADTLWTRTYGGRDFDGGYAVRQTTDGGFVVAGSTNCVGAGSYDAYLIKTNAQGDTLWTRTYGGPNADEAYAVRQTSDGGYVIAGFAGSFGAGNCDVYLIKTDANGSAGVAEPLTGHPLRPTRFLVQPNPFASFARVPGHEADVFALSDVTGWQVAVCKGDRIGVGLRPGVYFVSPVGSIAGKVAPATIVKTAF